MKLTKARVTIVVLSVLLAASLAAGGWLFSERKKLEAQRKEWEAEREIFEEATTGELVWRDGLWQDSLVYLTGFDINEESDRVTFTMCVLRSKPMSISDHGCEIQVKENGEWVYIPSYQAYLDEQNGEIAVNDIAWGVSPFSDKNYSCSFPPEDRLPGEYRVIRRFGTCPVPGGSAGVYAVGYFTIP